MSRLSNSRRIGSSSIVNSYLVEEGGLEGARLSAVGLADTRPLVENTDESTREANRRVQLVIVTEETPQ